MTDNAERSFEAERIDPRNVDALALPFHTGRKLYRAHSVFRVIREGARLEGMRLFGRKTWGGWSKRLELGDELTCIGWHAGWGSDSIPIAQWTMSGVPENTQFVSFWPHHSLFMPWPMNGFLELIDDSRASENRDRLDELTYMFQLAGGRGVELAEEIDRLQAIVSEEEAAHV